MVEPFIEPFPLKFEGKIEPCPWCGEIDKLFFRCSSPGNIECGRCEIRGPRGNGGEGEYVSKAFEAWNKRSGK